MTRNESLSDQPNVFGIKFGQQLNHRCNFFDYKTKTIQKAVDVSTSWAYLDVPGSE